MSGLRLPATFWPCCWVPPDGHLALWGTDDSVAAAIELGLPTDPAELPTVVPASQRASVPGAGSRSARIISMRAALRALASMRARDAWPRWQRPSDSLLAWSVAAKLALEHVATGNLIPYAGPGCQAMRCRACISGVLTRLGLALDDGLRGRSPRRCRLVEMAWGAFPFLLRRRLRTSVGTVQCWAMMVALGWR